MTLGGRIRRASGACAAFLLFVTAQIATQRTAAALGFQAALGAPVTYLFGRPFYSPWSFFRWEYGFRSEAPLVFARVELATAPAWGIAAFGLLVALVRPRKASTAYGSARWATRDDLETARLLGQEKGFVLAQTHDAVLKPRKNLEGVFDVTKRGEVLRHDGPDHILIFAPPRSGKGVGPFLGNLYDVPSGPQDNIDSVVVFDMTGENWAKSAGHRSRFSRCIKLAPFSRGTHRINPLLEARPGDYEVSDVQKISHHLVATSGAEANPHFAETAQELIAGGILHTLYVAGPKNLGALSALFSDSRPDREVLEMMADTRHLGDCPHPFVAAAANDQLGREERERSAVLSTVRRHLKLFRDPLAANAVSESDFVLDDIRDGDRPMSIYLVVPKSDVTRLQPILRLFLNQLAAKYTEDRTTKYLRGMTLFGDEFTSMGAVPAIADGLSHFGGAGVRAILNIHDLEQLDRVYGPHNPFVTNCKVKITYAIPNDKTADRVSRWIGEATFTRKDGQGKPVEYGRPLIYPAELLKLPPDEALIFKTGMAAPYRAKKLVTYSMDCYRGLDAIPPPDSAAQMAAQLPPRRPSAWSAMQAQPALPRPKTVVVPVSKGALGIEERGDQDEHPQLAGRGGAGSPVNAEALFDSLA